MSTDVSNSQREANTSGALAPARAANVRDTTPAVAPGRHTMPDRRSEAGSTRLPTPEPGRWEAEEYVATHLGHLLERRQPTEDSPSSPAFRGGQRAADEALAALSVDGYSPGRDNAYPLARRRVSQLSPWIRHGLLTLPAVVARLNELKADGQASRDDLATYGRELLWQEYARHWYARLGTVTRTLGLDNHPGVESHRAEDPSWSLDPQTSVDEDDEPADHRAGDATAPNVEGSDAGLTARSWDRRLGCMEITLDELADDGWLVGSTRRWLASQLTVRHGQSWRLGEEFFFRNLLDGSRATNRLAWLQVSGAGSEPSQGFSRWQVESQAPGLCASCEMAQNCPIEQWPATIPAGHFDHHPLLDHDPDLERTAGPSQVVTTGSPEAVWLTAESLGHADPALAANPDLPAVFVFDEPLLAKLRLSPKRLIFVVETLSELTTVRPVELRLGSPSSILAGRSLAATFTPVPGWRRLAAQLTVDSLYPWPWLHRPHSSQIDSFLAWQEGVE